ncbi:MAG: hypothetical protein WD767_02295 [Alphaproteobacteria bacterium]
MLDHPAIIAVAIPMGISVLAVVLSRTLGRQDAAMHVLSAGGLLGFFAAYVMLVGWPDAMPRTATQKLAYVALAGLFAGFLLDVAGNAVRALRWTVALPAAAIVWIALPHIMRLVSDPARGAMEWAAVIVVTILALAVLARIARPERNGRDGRLSRPENSMRDGRLAQLIAAAFGLGGICILGSAASLGLLAFAAAAVGAGAAIWNLGRQRARIGAGLVLGLGAVVTALAMQAALFTSVTSAALLLLSLCFVTDLLPFCRPMATPEKGYRILASAPPFVLAVLAVAVAFLLDGMPGGY